MGHVIEAPEDSMMQQIMEMRARNLDLQMRSVEKAKKGKTSGQIDCSPESVMIKHDHNYANPEDSPDNDPDPVNTTNHRGNERYQPLRNTNTPKGYAYQSTQSPTQYYYNEEPLQEGASYASIKLELHSDPP
jgi:hypothetical protein